MGDLRHWNKWPDKRLEDMLLGGAQPGSLAHEAAKYILDKRRREREVQARSRPQAPAALALRVDFSFLKNAALRRIAERDWDECQRAFASRCWKSVLILAGGIVETILLSLLSRRKARALKTKAPAGGGLDPWSWAVAEGI